VRASRGCLSARAREGCSRGKPARSACTCRAGLLEVAAPTVSQPQHPRRGELGAQGRPLRQPLPIGLAVDAAVVGQPNDV
jgi:hypothetical protein